MGLGSPVNLVKQSTAVLTLDANNTTVAEDIFTLTGGVIVERLWGVVTGTIGVNHTDAFWQLNDGGTQIELSASFGSPALSGLAVGTVVFRTGITATVAKVLNNAVGAISDAASNGEDVFTPFMATEKTGGTSTLQYSYATTDTPTSGEITFYAEWFPLTNDGRLS